MPGVRLQGMVTDTPDSSYCVSYGYLSYGYFISFILQCTPFFLVDIYTSSYRFLTEIILPTIYALKNAH